ncbi:hypothetical protein [Gluconacetobacter entanii]|nr:hypothetical protein [Gluconacetobacter entanii]
MNDTHASNAQALLYHIRTDVEDGKKIVTDEDWKDFKRKEFVLTSGYSGDEIETLPGRKRAAEIILSRGFDVISYENENKSEIRGIEIFSDYLSGQISVTDHPDLNAKTCYINLKEVEPKLVLETKTAEIDKICKEKGFDVNGS